MKQSSGVLVLITDPGMPYRHLFFGGVASSICLFRAVQVIIMHSWFVKNSKFAIKGNVGVVVMGSNYKGWRCRIHKQETITVFFTFMSEFLRAWWGRMCPLLI